MKSFKQFFTERQTGHSDFFLVLAGDIKLDRANACKIWEECGKRSTFRHITDYVGASFLIKNKKKGVAISAMKFSKEIYGIETTGDITLIIEADYEIWWPQDAFTFRGVDGKRWISMDIGFAFKKIFSQDFEKKYLESLVKLIKKYPNVNEVYKLSSEDGFENETGKVLELHKNETTKFTKAALALQLKMLDKHSDVIKKNLVAEFQKSKSNVSRRKDYLARDLDEAVVSNVVVEKVIFAQVNDLTNTLNELTGGLRYIERIKKESLDSTTYQKKYGIKAPTAKELKNMDDDLKINMDDNMDNLYSVKMLRDANYKGLFTYRTFSKPQFVKMKEAIKNPDFENAWNYLQKHYGIKIDKDVFLRLV